MSRLYEYADSNDKSGLFLLDGYKGNNTTFQVTTTAERLLLHLDYEPGTLHQERGPRIPDELHWGLFEIDWIFTKESDFTPPTNQAGEMIVDGDTVEITKAMADDIKSFLKETDDADENIDELSDILNLNISPDSSIDTSGTTQQTPIWDVSETRCQYLVDQVKSQLEKELPVETMQDWHIVWVDGTKEEFNGIEKAVFSIHATNVMKTKQEFFHFAYFCPEHGLERIVTAANEEVDWKIRNQLERHRQKIIESLVNVLSDENVSIGEPTCDLELITNHEPALFE